MHVKILEIRDRMTFIPVLCIWLFADNSEQQYYLRRLGHPPQGIPANVSMTKLNMGEKCCNDPYMWVDRTMSAAHLHISQNWEALKDGDVVDVQHILGETSEVKRSERFGG